MTDKNGIEIKTGDIVEISGAYFKNDNGLYFVERSPGDPSWCGSDYSLHRISKSGKISKAKNYLCFWPISVFVSDPRKAAEAKRWNKEYAQIEVTKVKDTSEVIAHFKAEADALDEQISRASWDFGEESEPVQRYRAYQNHYRAVAEYIVTRKSVNRYANMKRRHQEEFNAFPMKFAFSDKQFEEGMAELGLKPTDTDKVYSAPGGGFYRKEDSPKLVEMTKRHATELEVAIAADKTGEGFIYEMFLYELNNHEYGYTRDTEDTLDALGYTADEVLESPRLKRGIEKAVTEICGMGN